MKPSTYQYLPLIAWAVLGLNSVEASTITLALHLDASDFTAAGSISSWDDKSGNNRNATAVSDPTVVLNAQNGLAVVDLDGNDYFTIPDSFTAGSAFVVAQYDTATFTSYDGLLTGNNTGSGSDLYFAGNNGTDDLWFETSLDSRYFNGIAGTSNLSIEQMSLYSGTDSTPKAQNGYAIGADRPTVFNGGRAWTGDIAEVIIYEEALSDFDRKGVEVYLDEKWGLGQDLRATYGEGSFNSNLASLSVASVPEPSSTALFGLGAVALLMRRHK